MKAIGYIRQSRRADLDVALSYDAQLAAIHKLAERDGLDPDFVRILADMGRSGAAGKESKRSGYLEVVAAVAAGDVDAVYALSMTRLARSTVELYKLAASAATSGVRLVFSKEGTLDPGSPIGKAQFGLMAVFSEFERDLAVERAKDNVAERRKRGDRMGRIPYGDRPGDRPDLVVAAFRDGGSLSAAALDLNERHIRSHLGRDWTPPAVRLVVSRYAPELLPRRVSRGVKPVSPFRLFRLLRCHCGRLMTASRDGRGTRDVVYRCHSANVTPGHGPYRVQEGDVLPWIKAEAGRFNARKEGDLAERAERAEADRQRLEDQRRAVGDALVLRAYTPEMAAAKVAEIEAALTALDEERIVTEIPAGIDWDGWDAKTINTVLSTYWTAVNLGPDLMPVGAEWRLPEEWLAHVDA